MKKTWLLLGAVLTVSLCGTSIANSTYLSHFFHSKVITGNNQLVTQSQRLGAFNQITTTGHFNIHITQQPDSHLMLRTDVNLLPYIHIRPKNAELAINTQERINLQPSKENTLWISTPTLNVLTLGGNNIFDIDHFKTDFFNLSLEGKNQGTIQGQMKNVKLNLAGKSSINAKINHADNIELSTAGNSTVHLSGEVKNLKINSAGKITLNAKELIAQNILISGAGDSTLIVNAQKNLFITNLGKSDIQYVGHPEIRKNSFGETVVRPLGN